LSLGPGALQIAERALLVFTRPQVVQPQSTVVFAADGWTSIRLQWEQGTETP
jgi:hypothetical protein